MENKKEEKSCVFHITGGNNQIMPNATEVVQNFYGDQFGKAALKAGQSMDGDNKAQLSESEKPKVEVPDSLSIAEGELRIYYPDEASLHAIIARIGGCKDAADLGNLVVNDMMERTILNEAIAVKAHFIEALQMFIHFTKGSSVNNIRQQIRKQVSSMPPKGKELSDSIRGR